MTTDSRIDFNAPVDKDSFSAFCRLLYERHLVTGIGGNVSARCAEGFLVTPTGISLRDMTPGNVVVVRDDGSSGGDARPSKELSMHFGIFERRPEVNVVCHVHGDYIIAASTMLEPGPKSIPPTTPGFVYYAHPLPMIEFYPPGSPELAAGVAAAFGADRNLRALLLRNHGLITVGQTLAEAVNVAEEVDEAARVFVLTGGKASRIPEDLFDRIS